MAQIQRSAVSESLETLIGFVSEHAEKMGFPPGRVREVELAVEESLVNIMTYAYPKTVGDVQIRCERDDDSLVFAIVDFGVRFDPLSIPVPDLLAELAARQVGGLGVFFVRRLTDRAEYRREGDANVLILSFDKTASDAEA